jgi:hypothetical protein
MGVLLKRLVWKSAGTSTEVTGLSPITDVIDITARKGLDVKNNIMDFSLKNPNSKYVNSSTGLIRFQEDDEFELYVKLTTDASDIDTEWYNSNNLVGTYYLKEFEHLTSLNRHRINVTTIDKAYTIFNKVYARSYGFQSDTYWTAPGIFRSVTRSNTSLDSSTLGYAGTDNDSGSRFEMETNFVSEGGNITDRRDEITQLNGAISDSDTTITVDSTADFKDEGTLVIGTEHIYYSGKTSTTFTGCVRGIDDTTAESALDNATVYQGFPLVTLSKVWKPIYEWLSELGQPLNTNYADEQVSGGTLKYDRSFLLWVDKDNKIYWVPTTDTVDTSLEIGTDEIFELGLEKAVFDSVNMVIYNVGTDMNGAGLTWYWFDRNTDTNDLKMRYQPMIDTIDQLLLEWINYANANTITLDANDSDELRRFPDSSEYPLSDWSFKQDSNNWRNLEGDSARTTLTSDSDFNESLREAALWRGRSKAQNITARVGGLRYRGTITLNGAYYNPGDLVQITDSKTGLNQQLVRVIDVTQNIGKGQWSTTLEVEEDEEALQT